MEGKRLGVLDGLRGIAILLVVWFHIWQISWLPAPLPALQFIPESGFLGVDIFFFLSGFVISYPFVRAALEGTERPTWRHFATRRAVKIVPSYILSMVLAYAIGYAATQGGGDVPKDIITHLFFIHNWFAQTYGSINGVLWTLAVEVQFYCFFPLLLRAFLGYPVATATALVGVALGFRLSAAHMPSTSFLPQLIEQLPAYLDVFGCGMLGAWLFVRLRSQNLDRPAIQVGMTLAAIAGFIFMVLLFRSFFDMRYEADAFVHWKIVHRTWLAVDCLVIAVASLYAVPLWRKLLGNPILVFFALVSYNLYIYHQVIARELWWHHLPPWAGNDPHADPHWEAAFSLAAFIVATGAAALATYGFERPIMRLLNRRDRRKYQA